MSGLRSKLSRRMASFVHNNDNFGDLHPLLQLALANRDHVLDSNISLSHSNDEVERFLRCFTLLILNELSVKPRSKLGLLDFFTSTSILPWYPVLNLKSTGPFPAFGSLLRSTSFALQ